jgi:hypothetical protein
MLPAPARIAIAPRVRSRVSWNPAVPPPPVAGAALGKGLADGLGVGDGEGDGVRVADALAEGLADGLVLLLDGVGVAVLVDRAVAVAEAVPVGEPPGENDVGVPEGEPPVQAETDTEASTVTAAQPMALNLVLSRVPAMVERILMGPPHASAAA